MNQTAEAMLASMHRDAKIAEARKRHGKPFAHEGRVTRLTHPSRRLEELNSSVQHFGKGALPQVRLA